jgi:site-specific DNA-methyltransferase (adenine-specific)
MLDQLPEELWSDKNATFLDPVCKTGVFLREIAARLNKGLETEIPDQQERLNHIYTKQLFGIAITELTSLLSRRSVYCSKTANGKYSVCTAFDDEQGNIRHERTEHSWHNGRCAYCGASEGEYSREDALETHAYQFIHTDDPQKIFKHMKFDVIIGNPPYQLSDGGDGKEDARVRGGAMPLYQKFVSQSKKLNPRFIVMITPSRWFTGGRGLDDFRKEMFLDNKIRKIVDFPYSSECFPGVEIKGGVSYFVWNRDSSGDCEIETRLGNMISKMQRPIFEENLGIFVRFNEAVSILRKAPTSEENSFMNMVSAQKPFGLRTFFQGKNIQKEGDVKVYGNKKISFLEESGVEQNKESIKKHKVFITMAYGAGESFPHQILNKPFYGEPSSICTETYLMIGPFSSKKCANNVITYIKTRFFRFLVLMIKNTQHASRGVYRLVSLQDFSEPWTDEKLYKKYNLTKKEIAFIESMIKPME